MVPGSGTRWGPPSIGTSNGGFPCLASNTSEARHQDFWDIDTMRPSRLATSAAATSWATSMKARTRGEFSPALQATTSSSVGAGAWRGRYTTPGQGISEQRGGHQGHAQSPGHQADARLQLGSLLGDAGSEALALAHLEDEVVQGAAPTVARGRMTDWRANADSST